MAAYDRRHLKTVRQVYRIIILGPVDLYAAAMKLIKAYGSILERLIMAFPYVDPSKRYQMLIHSSCLAYIIIAFRYVIDPMGIKPAEGIIYIILLHACHKILS